MNVVSQDKKKTTREPTLKELMTNVKNLKVLLKETTKKKKEIEQTFLKKFKELEKLEIQLILWWDFWRREIKINRLQKQAGIGILPSEREKIEEQIRNLNVQNKVIEESFRREKVDTELIAKLRKELEEESEKEEDVM